MLKVIIALFLIILDAACTNPFGANSSTVSSGYGPNVSTPVPSATNIAPISGSLQNAPTTLNRKTFISAGSAVSKLKLSTANGRVAFLNVQGQILSK